MQTIADKSPLALTLAHNPDANGKDAGAGNDTHRGVIPAGHTHATPAGEEPVLSPRIAGLSQAPVRPTWVAQHMVHRPEWKLAMARFVAHHFVNYADVIQVGSGTSLNVLMDAIIERQRTDNISLDLVVLTSNLQVVAKASQASDQQMQIILTGGTLQSSLDALAGEYAARAISTDVFHPRVVFFGAAGLTFRDRRPISYHFPDEVGTQMAYATRPAEHRVVLCDHTKLGKYDTMNADLTLKQLITSAARCTIVSTWPEEEPDVLHRLNQEERALTESLRVLADDPDCAGKEFVLQFVQLDGRRHHEVTLAGQRASVPLAVAPSER